jgi:hypothetical protein
VLLPSRECRKVAGETRDRVLRSFVGRSSRRRGEARLPGEVLASRVWSASESWRQHVKVYEVTVRPLMMDHKVQQTSFCYGVDEGRLMVDG